MVADNVELRAVAPRRLPALDPERLRALGLSRRELAVLELVARGSTNAETADALGISPLTVKKHLERMYEATGARNRAALIALLSDGSVARARGSRAHNLPTPLTSFIGRGREIDAVTELLARARLVTLGGPGGIGKTRLALEVARRTARRFADGVRLVELGDLADPQLVLPAVVAAAGGRASGGPRIASLVAALRDQQLLLVFDNCEHVIAGCGAIIEPLLRSCPGVSVLATSRETLGAGGETFWPVRALSLPNVPSGSRPAAVALVETSEAVRLFVERAGLRSPGFRLSPENAGAVARICLALDGLPLAIELAAARLAVLTPDEIAHRLSGSTEELRTDASDVAPRHRSMQAVLDWSYRSLTSAEARLFLRLSVFVGGWALDAAETVCAHSDLPRDEVIALLSRLVDRSFVVADARDGQSRYRTLETLRQYARERYDRDPEAEAIHLRHAEFCCLLAERAEPELRGADQQRWMDRLDLERDNLRAALRWSIDAGSPLALRTAAALWRYWFHRGLAREGMRWLEDALAKTSGAPPSLRLKALNAAGNLVDDRDRSETLHRECLAFARSVEDLVWTMRSLSNVADRLRERGELGAARAMYDESSALAADIDDPWCFAISTSGLGHVARLEGDVPAALAHYRRALPAMRRSGDRLRGAHIVTFFGDAARAGGRPSRAATFYRRGLVAFRALGDRIGAILMVEALGLTDIESGRVERGLRLVAAASAARERHLYQHLPRHDVFGNEVVRAAAVALARHADASAAVEGRDLPLEGAIDLALSSLTPSSRTWRPDPT